MLKAFRGWSTLVAGSLLLLISFTTNYGDDNLFQFGTFQTSEQIGVGLHLAALAALAGDAQLATRLRHRAANEAARTELARQREAYAREREKRLKLLQESNAIIARFEQELFSSSNPAPSTGDSSPT